jgi:D-inositol-3-phosphate glycosyltransferase
MLSVHSCPLGRLGEENTGGMSVYIRELSRALGARGHRVDIFTRTHGPVHDPIAFVHRNVRLIHVRAGMEEEIPKLALYDHLPEFARHVERFRRSEGLQYDLIHSHYWLSGRVGAWMKARWNVPHLVMFHTLGAVKNSLDVGEEEPRLRIEIEKQVVLESDRIIGSTDEEKGDLLQYYGARPETIRVIPCGVNLDLFRPVDRRMARRHLNLDGEGIILFVGRVVPIKGLERLLMAMPYLGKERRVRLLVIGGNDKGKNSLGRLKDLTRVLRIPDAVTFCGLVQQERLPLFYSAADVCVVPSYHESFGLVALESLACGTPVVGTRVGILGRVIQPGVTGYVVTDTAPHHLANKIDLALSTLNRRPGSVGFFRASVSPFSWSHIVEAVIQEYRSTAAEFLDRMKPSSGIRPEILPTTGYLPPA